MPHRDLLLATLGTDGTGSVAENYHRIQQGIAWCQDHGIAALITNECALTGYPPVTSVPSLKEKDSLLRSATSLLQQSQAADVTLVLGLAVPDGRSSDNGWWNEVHWLDSAGAVQRYRKQALMPSEKAISGLTSPATPGLITIQDWVCAVHICYEIRFPGILAAGAQQADALLAVAHMAGPDPDGVKAEVIPAHYSTRAAEWACPLILANTCAADQVLPAGAWNAAGQAAAAMLSDTVDSACTIHAHKMRHRDASDPWLSQVREDQLKTCHFDSSHKD